MNTQTLLNQEQKDNRTQKGLDIYNSGLVEKVNSREYLVKGRYVVEDLTIEDEDITPFYKCSCPDHKYNNVECKHIISVQFYMLGGA